jgi:CubicO group peptidase (beta-lactamase class C family)
MKTLALLALCPLLVQNPQDKKPPAEPPVYDRAKLAQRIEEVARAAVEKDGVPGLTIAVAEADDVFFAKGWGYADAEHARPASDTTRYPIGTLTRQFTAAAVLQLVDQEKIKLEDGIEKYLPEFPRGEHKVTIQHMLSNTSGIPGFEKLQKGAAPKPPSKPGAKDPPGEKPKEKDKQSSLAPQDKADPKQTDAKPQKEAVLEAFEAAVAEKAFFAQFQGVPFDFEPGADFSLDSANYALLSIIVARVAKQPYTQYVKEKLLVPVGLTETQFCPVSETTEGFARDCKSAWTVPEPELPTAEARDVRTQVLCTTARDLVKWQKALLDRAVFSERGARRIMAPTTLGDGNSTNFGYAIQMSKFHDFKNYAYTGQGGGFASRLSYWSLPKVTIVVLANCDAAPVERIERDIACFLLSIPLPPTEETALSPEDAARCVGLYQIATTQYRIVLKDGQLWFTPPVEAATRLCHRGALTFAFESDRNATLTFHVAEGKCDGFTIYRGGFETKARRMD